MKELKKILFPTDFSESSANAFRYALLLADHLEASVEVLHVAMPVVDTITYTGYSSSSTQALVESLNVQIQDFINRGLAEVADQMDKVPEVSPDVILGTAVHSIIHISKRDEVDFILMGSRGEKKGMLNKILGSTAAGVVDDADCPVIIIPEHSTFKPYMSIAYATDLSDADPFEIWKAVKLLNPISPNARVIHIRMPNENTDLVDNKMKEMQSFFNDQHPEIDVKFNIIPGNDLQKELDALSEIYMPDIMVMYQPHHSLWDRLFHKSNTKERAAHTQLPLLIQKDFG